LHRFGRSARLSLDTILGFVLPFFMAIGVLLLSLSPGFSRSCCPTSSAAS
jgi:ABC-type Mn2+/Zn2+ transport system permease subunit